MDWSDSPEKLMKSKAIIGDKQRGIYPLSKKKEAKKHLSNSKKGKEKI